MAFNLPYGLARMGALSLPDGILVLGGHDGLEAQKRVFKILLNGTIEN
jgi:hypothetical protein